MKYEDHFERDPEERCVKTGQQNPHHEKIRRDAVVSEPAYHAEDRLS